MHNQPGLTGSVHRDTLSCIRSGVVFPELSRCNRKAFSHALDWRLLSKLMPFLLVLMLLFPDTVHAQLHRTVYGRSTTAVLNAMYDSLFMHSVAPPQDTYKMAGVWTFRLSVGDGTSAEIDSSMVAIIPDTTDANGQRLLAVKLNAWNFNSQPLEVMFEMLPESEGGVSRTIWKDPRLNVLTLRMSADMRTAKSENTLIDGRYRGVRLDRAELSPTFAVKLFSIVRSAYKQISTQRLGTGILLSDAGYIITNFHVVNPDDIAINHPRYIVTFPNCIEAEATLVHGDPDHDLALLRIVTTFNVRKYIPSGRFPFVVPERHDIRLGANVFTMGYPFIVRAGRCPYVAGGTISSLDASELYFVSTIPITDGNSGGGVFDMFGNLIGITTATKDEMHENFCLGIKHHLLVDFLRRAAREELLSRSPLTRPFSLLDWVEMIRPYIVSIRVSK
jgi:S1-C subfamily serine protease